MTDKLEFINREIVPMLGDFVDDFDLDGICDEVADFDPREGYVWKKEFTGEYELYTDDLNEVLQRHDITSSDTKDYLEAMKEDDGTRYTMQEMMEAAASAD